MPASKIETWVQSQACRVPWKRLASVIVPQMLHHSGNMINLTAGCSLTTRSRYRRQRLGGTETKVTRKHWFSRLAVFCPQNNFRIFLGVNNDYVLNNSNILIFGMETRLYFLWGGIVFLNIIYLDFPRWQFPPINVMLYCTTTSIPPPSCFRLLKERKMFFSHSEAYLGHISKSFLQFCVP